MLVRFFVGADNIRPNTQGLKHEKRAAISRPYDYGLLIIHYSFEDNMPGLF